MKHSVKWFEIPAVDFSRAVQFYATVFEVELKTFECEEEKMAFFPEKEDTVNGMISQAKDFNPSKDGVVIYFDAENKMDKLIDRITNSGGSILTGKTKIEAEGRGYFALIKDSEGNRIGLYSDK